MENLITVSSRGSLTLPKELRKKLGIPKGGPISVTITVDGILLTPVAAYPNEMYSEARVAEFNREEAKLRKFKLK